MKTKELNESINKLTADSETKKGILELIDLKIENDMKEVINEIRRLEDKQDVKYNAIESKISILMWAIGMLIVLILGIKLFL